MTEQQSSSGAMRRVVVSTGRVDVVRANIPQPGPGEVLVRSVLAGVCGSTRTQLRDFTRGSLSRMYLGTRSSAL
jgi:threonine dehydrogenase-like Zn-dependent dehydrogenase